MKKPINIKSILTYSTLSVLIISLFVSNKKIDFSKGDNLLFHNGPIITMERDRPSAESVYIENGIIRSIGDYENIRKTIKPSTRIIDLKGKTLLPGFIDSHTHPVISAFLYDMVDLSGFTHNSKEDLWIHFSDKVSQYKPGEWILCKGFDQVLIQGLLPPKISFLDSIAPNNPVLIASQSLHSYWANSLAFKESGIDQSTPDPDISSYYERDSLGNLTGYIAEQAAFEPIKNTILEAIGISKLKTNSLMVMNNYAKNGFTSITSMGITTSDKKVIHLYDHISSQRSSFVNDILSTIGILPERNHTVRNFVFVRYDAAHLLPSSSKNGDDFFKIVGIKFWYDGSPYTGSMYLEKPYLENYFTKNILHFPPAHSGSPLLTKDQLGSLIAEYQAAEWQVAVHTQGDMSTREVIDTFEKLNTNSKKDYRHRLEHCLLVDDISFEKMSKLNLYPSFHINHLYYYGQKLESKIIGPSRGKKILPINLAAERSIKFTLHADQPMFSSEPFSLIHTAVNRKTKEGKTLGKQYAIDVYKALEALTINAASQIKMEDKLGSITKGKYADLIILDQNPLDIDKNNLQDIKVIDTYVHGNKINLNP